MTNRREDVQDVYFGIFGYGSGMYAKYSQNLSRNTTYVKRTGNAYCDWNTSDEGEGGSHNALTIGWQPSFRQDYSSGFIKTGTNI